MLLAVATFLAQIGGFCLADMGLTALGVASPYYLVHAIHNAYIVSITWQDTFATLTDYRQIGAVPFNWPAVSAVVALHLYHCILYWRKFRFDDWLHHVLMIGVAIPLGAWAPANSLMSYSLFFTTGLPGCIDYTLLFLVRNGLLARNTEKRVNRFLNVWVRSPGAASQAAFVSSVAFTHGAPTWVSVCWFIPGVLNYWNGQYFMAQVVEDWAIVNRKNE